MKYERFMEIAKENYNNGGDAIVECWDRNSFEYYEKEFGEMTIEFLNYMMEERREELEVIKNMKDW